MDDRNELRLREWERFTKGSRPVAAWLLPASLANGIPRPNLTTAWQKP